MKISAELYNKMPSDLQALFEQCPNPSRDEVVGLFPESKGWTDTKTRQSSGWKQTSPAGVNGGFYGDTGSAARFFYCAKASKRDRDEGLEGFELKDASKMSGGEETRPGRPTNHPMRANHHPTVKPTDLMRYLCRLVTPPDGIVLDPFMGSGSTGKAAILEGFQFIGIEREAEYLTIAEARISHASGLSQPPQRPTRQPAPACPGQLALF